MGKRKDKKESLPEFTSSIGWLWNLMGLLIVIATIVQIFTLINQSWRVAQKIVYTYKFRNSRLNHQVGITHYGLFKVNYDANSSQQSWDVKVQIAKVKAMAAAQIGQQPVPGATLNMWSSMCPPPCQDAVIFRAQAYDLMRTTNTILLAGLALSGAIALGGVAWMIIMGRDYLIIIGCWLVSLIICSGALGYWYYDTTVTWRNIVSKEQVPFPEVGLSFFLNLGVIGIYLITACGIHIANTIDQHKRKAQIERDMAINLLNENNTQNPNIYDGFKDLQQQMPPETSSSWMPGFFPGAGMGFNTQQPFGQNLVPSQYNPGMMPGFGYPQQQSNLWSTSPDPRSQWGSQKPNQKTQGFGNFPR